MSKMNFKIKNLGTTEYKSPIYEKIHHPENFFQKDDCRMMYNIMGNESPPDYSNSYELAGPREHIYFKPSEIKSAIITCGGLCPGINDVIRSIVMESFYRYGNKSILGIQYGYNGFNKIYNPIQLTPELVLNIHRDGGTILGSSRGGTDDMNSIIDSIEELGINILYTIGGDGTLNGAHEISKLVEKRGLKLSVVGIPKTIDNDISFIQKSFGFETAYSKAVESISAAHVEAKGAPNGIGIVKLMGRHSGFIAANAALAMNDVNFLFIPEVDFDSEANNGFLKHLENRLAARGHAVICVAEGAGQKHLKDNTHSDSFDASGNIKLDDIGVFFKNKINSYFKGKDIPVNIKYIDPSYLIRSSPAVPSDSIYCALLGQNAVHAAMAGKTDLIIGQWNNNYCHIPIELAISKRKMLNSRSRFWYGIIEATGQPISMLN